MKRLVATAACRANGRVYRPGEEFAVGGSIARVLVALRRARYVPATAALQQPPLVQGRALVAEPDAEPQAAEQEAPPLPEATAAPRRRRTYKRRDLRPEE